MLMQMQSVEALAEDWHGTSDITRNILPAHAQFIGERLYDPHSGRGDPGYMIADAQEPNLSETWSEFEKSYRARPRLTSYWTAVLKDAVVHPPFGIVSVGDSVVRETVVDARKLTSTFPGMDKETARRAIRSPGFRFEVPDATVGSVVEEPTFLLGWGLADNYFNWTLRYLSKVRQWQMGASDRKLLAPKRTASFQVRSMEFLGVPQRDVLLMNGPALARNLMLTAPSALGRYELSPLIVQNLRDHPRVDNLWRAPKRMIYIPRVHVKFRRVDNEAQVIELMRSHGFAVFDNDLHPMPEQIRAYRDAKVIVGPHGAGLTNIVYSSPGTKVLEIVPEGYDQGVTSYRSLADHFGLEYSQMFAREARLDRKGNRCNSDISISLPHLDEAVRSLVADAD